MPLPQKVFEHEAVALYDVSYRVKSWGRRGLLAGGTFGFTLGAAFVAVPLTSDVLTFGVIGTLIVAAVEGAVVAGAFGACAAALYGTGMRRGGSRNGDRALSSGRRAPRSGWRDGDIPLCDWPAKRTHSDLPITSTLRAYTEPSITEELQNTDEPSLQSLQARLNTVDAWENGSTGP